MGRASPGREIRSWAVEWSRAGRSRRVWSEGSGWRTSRPSVPSPALASRSTSGALPGPRPSKRSLSTEKDPEHMAADPSYPDDLLYHAEHDWARVEGENATFGITWYAQDALGEVVFFDPPKVGAEISMGDAYTEVESVKAVSDVIAPLSGEIVEVNGALSDNPEKINEDPYGEGWLVKVKLSDPAQTDVLMSAADYEATLDS